MAEGAPQGDDVREPVQVDDAREPIQVQLTDFDSHGTTRARVGRRWIEVEHGIPGEVVQAEFGTGKRPMGRILQIEQAAPDRVEPPCPYFRDWKCGGCQWQHLSYEGQLERKRGEVDAAMAASELEVRVSTVHALDDPWRYRSTAGVALGRHAGFRRRASQAIVPIEDCPISHLLIGELTAGLNALLVSETLPNYHGRVRLEVRLVEVRGREALLVLVRPDPQRRVPREQLEVLFTALQSMPQVAGITFIAVDGSMQVISGELFGRVTVAGRPVSLAAGSFFQTNLQLLPKLIDRLKESAGDLKGKRVADVYGGVGVFGLFLAEGARDVGVIESDELAIRAGRETAQAWGTTNVRFLPGRAEDELEGDGPHDLILVDPPRSGLSEPVIEAISNGRPETILYVSCLAESLARDLQQLAGHGYVAESLELFDFYPQTYHVELLAVLRLHEVPPEDD
jgi:23S rRNA (uracil1939-C5)-methyltransferase